jgi:hypothetical protein
MTSPDQPAQAALYPKNYPLCEQFKWPSADVKALQEGVSCVKTQ